MRIAAKQQLAIGVLAAILGTMVWTGGADAFWFWKKLKQCRADLRTCDAELMECDAELAQCEATAQSFPGDGYSDPSLGTYGHEPELSYTDNGDLTTTDNVTKFQWEQKLTGGNCGDPIQANRSVHCVHNEYTWSDGAMVGGSDGTLFEDFLWALNNTCSEDALLALNDPNLTECTSDADCTEACGFAGYRNWEIPNIKKLQSIVDYNSFLPAMHPSFPGVADGSSYWSSTTVAIDLTGAWGVDFEFGVWFTGFKANEFRARAVRTNSE